MQIPTGNFGNAVARPGPMVNVSSDNPIGDAAQRTTQIAGNVVNDMAAEDRKRQDEQKRASAALALAKTSNDMHDAHDQVARGVEDGSIPLDKASGELQSRIGKVRDQALSGYSDPAQRDTIDAHLQGTEGTLQRSLAGAVVKRQQHNAAASIDDFGEQMGRFAMRDGPGQAVANYASFVRNTAPSAGLDEKAQGHLIQAFTEKTHADFFSNAATAALTTGNADALRQLRTQIAGPDGDPMDPQRRATLTHTIFGWEQSILARQDRLANTAAEEQRRRYNEAADLFNKGADISMAGGYLAPEFIKQMVETSAGTEMAPRVQALISGQRLIAGFATQPADQRAQRLERFRAERANPQQGVDPLDEKLLNALTTMDDKLRRQADENPWQAAQAAGVIQEAPIFNLTDPATAVQTIQQRMAQISTVEAWTGKRASPLQPQEVEQLSKFVRQLPVDQAGTMLGRIGDAMGNGERVAALGKQLHDKDGTLGLAMMYASAGTTQGRNTAELVLRGEQALKDKTARIDPAMETGWKGTIAKTIRGAYSNREVEDQVIDAAYKIAAARYAEGSGADLDNAVRLATGGIIERNGQKVPLPYGMTESDFDKKLGSIKPQDIRSQLRAGPDLTDLQAPAGSFDASTFGKRQDGTAKGTGYLGVLRRPDGNISTELSVGVNIGGKDMEVPTLVPTLTKEQVARVLSLKDGERMPDDVVQKAVDFARQRIGSGKPVFAGPGDSSDMVYVGRTPMPVDQFVENLPKAALVHAGQGIYNVRAGASLVTNAQGKRISLRIAP